jgi:endo-1,4-beta-xylanase
MPLSRREFCRGAVAASAFFNAIQSHAMAQALDSTGLKDLYKNDFRIGTAISNRTLQLKDEAMLGLIAKEFNAITPENCMKWGLIHPEAERWDWELPDRLVQFGVDHRMFILGHTLVWHSQVARGLFVDSNGSAVSRETLLKTMENHIRTLAGRYRGKVTAWDVVNEAVDEDKGWRKSPWHTIIGPEFMEKAFHWAREADDRAQLLYNDYNMHNPAKAGFVAEFVRDFKKRGVPIDGVGMQCHEGLDYSSIAELEASILLLARAGARVHITELDVDVLPRRERGNTAEISARAEYSDALNPWPKGLPEEMEKRLAKRYEELFRLFLKHRDKIDRITTWGTSDDESWKNNFPIAGRTNYPLLFDRKRQRKLAYHAVAALKK